MIFNHLTEIRQIKRFKNYIKSKFGYTANLTIDYKCPREWYGNAYGGFYINPDTLNKNAVIYSFGIGQDISFDLTAIAKHDCQVFGFDPTPKSIAWVKAQKFPINFTFEGIGVGKENEKSILNLPKNEDAVSGSLYVHEFVDQLNYVEVELQTFQYIANRLGHKTIDVLKMDIEGAEYDTIDNIINSNIAITQILLEIHERFFEDGKQKTELLLKKLKDKGYKLFAISDSYQELSFIKI